jgi:hypothetical protein
MVNRTTFEVVLKQELILKISKESHALEFHTYEEIKKMDIAATNRPIIDAYFSDEKRPVLR